MHLSDRIRGLRAQNRLTQEDLAKRVGIKARTIRAYENGDVGGMSLRNLSHLALALKTTPAELLIGCEVG